MIVVSGKSEEMDESKDSAGLPLGRDAEYAGRYDPDLLYVMPRADKRAEIGLTGDLPFDGCDLWTAYELSWLNPAGKPVVAIAQITIPCSSERIVESKSVKLYINSFAQTRIADEEEVRQILTQDLERATGAVPEVRLIMASAFGEVQVAEPNGICVDEIDTAIEVYAVEPACLSASGPAVSERLYSNLLRSNCPETDQPDWGTVCVHYGGPSIDREGFLKYVVSYREHHEFHEHCVERMFVDIAERCKPERLTVYARYTRRGGIDINPFRSNFEAPHANARTARQ
jgi:7-cyano-7-deazaguanine reductase